MIWLAFYGFTVFLGGRAMCIFCERAKASIDDPLAGFGIDDTASFGDGNTRSLSTLKAKKKATSSTWEATLKQKREAERCEELRRRARLPVTVITGFLGAGKTTFVNHLLSSRHGRRLAVIENEFGEVAVDDELLGDGGVERGDEAQQVIIMPNGCMCCRVRGDLVAALKRLIAGAAGANTSDQTNVAEDSSMRADDQRARRQEPAKTDNEQSRGLIANQEALKLDGVILECSGLDELSPVLQTFFADPFVQEHVRLDAVVCLCDSPRLLRTFALKTESDAASRLNNKEDTEGIASNEHATESRSADTSASLVMSQLALSDRVLLNKADLINSEEGDSLVAAVKEHFPGASMTRCTRGQVDIKFVLGVEGFSLDRALEMDNYFAEMLAGPESASRKNGHHHHRSDEETHLHSREDFQAESRSEREVHSTGVSNARKHGHDRLGATSVGMELTDGPIDWAMFKTWLKSFLEKDGERIWRLKGVLWTSTSDRDNGRSGTMAWSPAPGGRTVLQGLYGHFESEVGKWPAGSTRRSRLVFIGDLPPAVQETLKAGVRSCVAPPRQRKPPSPPRQQAKPASRAGGNAAGFADRFGAVKFGGRDDDLLL